VMLRLSLLVIVVCLFSTSVVLADDKASDAPEEDKAGVLAGVGSLVDDTHGTVSNRFSNFIIQVDDFIASGESTEELNRSLLRVRLDTIQPGGEDVEFSAKAKLRIVLPQSENRFRLLFSNEDDISSSANSDAAQREQIANEDDNDVSFALRFIRTARTRTRLKYDLGARVKDDDPQLFGRFIASYELPGKFKFTHSYTNGLTYFSKSGYQNTFRVDSRRNFFDKENLFFRNSLEFNWREGLKGVAIGEIIGIYASLGERRALAFEGLTGYATSLNPGVEDRFRGAEVRLRFRHSIWREWFYYEIWPSVSWSSTNDYEKAYGGLFRVEVTFGNI